MSRPLFFYPYIRRSTRPSLREDAPSERTGRRERIGILPGSRHISTKTTAVDGFYVKYSYLCRKLAISFHITRNNQKHN